MNKLFTALLACLLFVVSCGTGKQAASGKQEPAMLSFTTPAKEPITVTVDGETYELTSVKTKVWEVDRNIKKTPQNTVFLMAGTHHVLVSRAGQTVFDKQVQLGIREHRVINLETGQ